MPERDPSTLKNESGPRPDEPLDVGAAAADAPSSLAASTEPLPATIGRFRILRLLGEGATAVVYEAEQEFPHRAVALKVIRAGYASSEMIRRFENEAHALGRLQHPGIARIFEAGTVETPFGRQPYFAMELVRGQSLLDYCHTHRPDLRQRLELMAKICDAVEHAHQRALIHRDLKPANILVDESGQPRVLDFGVARLTDSDAYVTMQTNVGQIVGTLAYMSPEQVLGDPAEIDTRSDVYSLGMVLYEVLAGEPPYAIGRQLTEVVRTIREQEPARLGAVNRAYRGDIEIIAGKALEKDKARRYSSAAELAGDLRRHLRDEPIAARPPSASYQLRKLARRHKALVLGAAAVLVVLVLGVVVSTRLAVKAWRAEARARQQSAIAQAVTEFLQRDVLAQASARNQSGPGASLDPDLKVRTALDRAAARIDGKFGNQPEVEAAIRETMGKTYAELAQYAESRKQLEHALELERRLWGAEDPRTLRTQGLLGRTAWHEDKFAEAETLLSGALEIQQRVLGPEHPDTLFSRNNLGNVYRALDKDGQAEALYSRNLEIQRRVLGPEHPDTLISMNNLANVYWLRGKYEQAEALYGRNLEIQRRVLGPEHPDTLLSMGNLADTNARQGKYAQAATLFDQTLEISRRVQGPDHPRTLNVLADVASMHQRRGEFALAETHAAQVLAGRRRGLGPDHPANALSFPDLALAYASQGKFVEGERLAREALAFNGGQEPDHWQRNRAKSLLGASLAGRKKYAEAEPLLLEGYQGLLAHRAGRPASDRYHLELARGWVVQLYQAWGKPDNAAAWSQR